MPQAAEYNPELNKRRTEVTSFLTSLMTTAKSSVLYKDGHPMIMQMGERIVGLLNKTLGGEQNLTLEVKAKTVLIEEMVLPESAEIMAFAQSLHTLGCGGVLFTNRVTSEGMVRFFRTITMKPDEKNTLTDLQKRLQETRIDGLQLSFILSFVSTGETEQEDQKPGELSEEQIDAFLKAPTLPDLMMLLLHQSEDLRGKDAETVTTLLDKALFREISVERLEESLPWDLYDPRIKTRFQKLRAESAWQPKPRGKGRNRAGGWDRDGLISWSGLYSNADAERLHEHHLHEHRDALPWSLDKAHQLLDHPVGPSQPKYALYTYIRLLRELSRDGKAGILLAEFPRWEAMETSPVTAKLFPEFKKAVQDRVLGEVFAEQFVANLGELNFADPEEKQQVADFCVFFGPELMPLFIEELRRLADKDLRARFCALLALIAQKMGLDDLVRSLADEDWFLVVNVIGILTELGSGADFCKDVAPCLKHKNAKTREAAMKFLVKFGGPDAADGIAEFVATTEFFEETPKAVINLSLLRAPGIDKRLLECYAKTSGYDTQVSIVRALSRFPGPETIRFLIETARRTWYEIFTGINKELRKAAKSSLEQIRSEGKH